MNLDTLRKYCLSMKGVTEDMPFDNITLVFKVMGKIFLLTDTEGDLWINLKCDPEKALELRASYPAVQPGYHMNKKHWNTVYCDGSLEDKLILDMVRHSYDMVVKGLGTLQKAELRQMEGEND